MPPNRARCGFYWYYTRQVWPALLALMAVGLVVSLIEVSLFRYVASIVDLLKATSAGQASSPTTAGRLPGWASSS